MSYREKAVFWLLCFHTFIPLSATLVHPSLIALSTPFCSSLDTFVHLLGLPCYPLSCSSFLSRKVSLLTKLFVRKSPCSFSGVPRSVSVEDLASED